MKKIIVLVSGSGSNLQAIIDACEKGLIQAKVCAVIANKKDAYGLVRAQKHNIPTHFIDPLLYQHAQPSLSKKAYDQALIDTIVPYQADLIVLAGFMRILSPKFVQKFKTMLINIHPSLLPKYPGLNTHQRVLESQDKEHGASVHFVTEELDGGPVILQAKVPVFETDTVHTLQTRVLSQEHLIYPKVIQWFIQGRLEIKDNLAWLDNQKLEVKFNHTNK